MKKLVAVVVLLAVGATAADLTGKWSGVFKVDGGDHDIPQVFILKQDGAKLAGSGGPDPEEQYPIENGSIDGDHVKFEITTGEWKFAYDLRRAGQDGMQGDLDLKSIHDRRTAKVSLSRTKP